MRWLKLAIVVALIAFLLAAPFLLRTFYLRILTEILIWGALAMAINIMSGYTGLAPFGQAGIFGTAAYVVGFLVVKAGIDQVYHSTRYFSDTQLTELSDAGWFVFGQENPEALPVCIHQLTTDPSTLETGEYSVVKNFDYISMFFQDILNDFIGRYNITDETLGFLRQSLVTGIDLLKLRKYARIGAPLNEGAISSLAVNETISDRVEAYMTIQMPKPLNRIGLHLISD